VIPASVRYAPIPANAKLLYGEISSLCNQSGYCWATNQYFAELYKVDRATISVWLSNLVQIHAVWIEIDQKGGNKRKIHLLDFRGGLLEKSNEGIEKNLMTSLENSNTLIIESNTKLNNNIEPELFLNEAKQILSFRESPVYPMEVFRTFFIKESELYIDLVYYHQSVSDWSDTKNGRTKRNARGWIATARNFMRKDQEKGKLKTIQKVSDPLTYLQA
jgi:hypothetical protein